MDLTQYSGKKILVTRKIEGKVDAEEVEGKAEVANATGILLKPKGQIKLEIISIEDIIEVKFVQVEQKPLSRKVLKVIEFGQAQVHLLDRHGLTLTAVNKMTEKEAFEGHQSIDHEAADLGHTHGDKKKTARSEAVEAEA